MEPDLYRRQLMLAENHQSPFFDARRARLASVKDVIEAQRARWAAFVDLERAVGVAVLEATTPQR